MVIEDFGPLEMLTSSNDAGAAVGQIVEELLE